MHWPVCLEPCDFVVCLLLLEIALTSARQFDHCHPGLKVALGHIDRLSPLHASWTERHVWISALAVADVGLGTTPYIVGCASQAGDGSCAVGGSRGQEHPLQHGSGQGTAPGGGALPGQCSRVRLGDCSRGWGSHCTVLWFWLHPPACASAITRLSLRDLGEYTRVQTSEKQPPGCQPCPVETLLQHRPVNNCHIDCGGLATCRGLRARLAPAAHSLAAAFCHGAFQSQLDSGTGEKRALGRGCKITSGHPFPVLL